MGQIAEISYHPVHILNHKHKFLEDSSQLCYMGKGWILSKYWMFRENAPHWHLHPWHQPVVPVIDMQWSWHVFSVLQSSNWVFISDVWLHSHRFSTVIRKEDWCFSHNEEETCLTYACVFWCIGLKPCLWLDRLCCSPPVLACNCVALGAPGCSGRLEFQSNWREKYIKNQKIE